MAKRKNPNSNHKTGGIGFAVTVLALSSIFGFSPFGIIAGVVIGLGIGKITSIMGSGLDTTTHNRQDVERARQEEAVRAAQEAERKRQEEERKKQEAASKIPLTGNEEFIQQTSDYGLIIMH